MRLLFNTMSGHTFAERIKTTDFIIETKDGYHPMPPSAIFRDRERKDDALVIVNQGVIAPENARQTRDYMNDVCANIEVVRFALQSQRINKMWKRQVAGAIKLTLKYGLPLVVLIGVAYIFLGGIFA